MKANVLSKFVTCDPDRCSIAANCPHGPVPGAPCFLKAEYSAYVDGQVNATFAAMASSPEAELRINTLLKPLFEQLLRLRIAELGVKQVYSGKLINPIFRELRSCIKTINDVLTEAVKAYKADTQEDPERIAGGMLGSMIDGKGYYEMLCHDGQVDVESRVGPD